MKLEADSVKRNLAIVAALVMVMAMVTTTAAATSTPTMPTEPTSPQVQQILDQMIQIQKLQSEISTNLHLQIIDLHREIMLLKWRLAGISIDLAELARVVTLGDYIIIDQEGRVWLQRGDLRRLSELDLPEAIKTGPEPMVPLRLLAETLGHNVRWDNDDKTAYVTNVESKEFFAIFTTGKEGVILGSNNRMYVPWSSIAMRPWSLIWEHGYIDLAVISNGVLLIKISGKG